MHKSLGKTITLIGGILYLAAGAALIFFGLEMLIHSYGISGTDVYAGESRFWGIVLSIFVLVLAIAPLFCGIMGLVMRKHPIAIIVLGGVSFAIPFLSIMQQLISGNLTPPDGWVVLILILVFTLPIFYIAGGIIDYRANKTDIKNIDPRNPYAMQE